MGLKTSLCLFVVFATLVFILVNELSTWEYDRSSIYRSGVLKDDMFHNSNNVTTTVGVKNDSTTRYLEYVPHGGFSNQKQSLKNALRMAHLLDRVLILPPVMPHRNIKYGRCSLGVQSGVKPNNITRDIFHKYVDGVITAGEYTPMESVLQVDGIADNIVPVIDFKEFYTTKWRRDMEAAVVPYNCIDTAWTCPNAFCHPRRASTMSCRNISDTIGDHSPYVNVDLLHVGSVFAVDVFGPASLEKSALWYQSSTLEFSLPIKTAIMEIVGILGNFTAGHFRVGDSKFKANKDTLFEHFQARIPAEGQMPTTFFLATDAKEEDKVALVSMLQNASYSVSTLDDFAPIVSSASIGGTSLDVRPFLDQLVCVYAKHFFGTLHSTYSKAIVELREKQGNSSYDLLRRF